MITFRQFLDEKSMGAATFADTEKRLGDVAKVGFEFEIVVPKDSPYYVQSDKDDRESMSVLLLDSLKDFEMFFEMSRFELRSIERDYDMWVDKHRDEYVEQHYEKLMNDDTSESEARQIALDEFDTLLDRSRGVYSFDDWIKDEFGNSVGFVVNYNLQPKFGWEIEPPSRDASFYTEQDSSDDDDKEGTLNEVAAGLQNIVDANVRVHTEYHETEKNETSWYVEPDSSIQGGHGVEIVSPPQKLKKALSDLEDVCEWIAGDGLETNETTGFHINVSVPGIKEKLDKLKLALFLGERYSIELFNRLGNQYSQEHLTLLIRQIKDSGRIPSSFSSMQKMAQNFLIDAKYMSVNFGNLAEGYLEFRFAGNEGYERDVPKLKQAVLRAVTAVELACDPEAEKQEYAKKLVKVFNLAKDAATKFDFSQTDIPFELKRLAKINEHFRQMFLRFQKSSDSAIKKNLLIGMMDSALAGVRGVASELSPKEIAFLKLKAKEVRLTPADLDDYYGTDSPRATEVNINNRAEFKKAYRI